MKKTRIDVYMVEKGISPSRTKAQDLIRAGLVSLKHNGQLKTVHNSSELVEEDLLPEVVIQKSTLDKYASRAGLKMDSALSHLGLSVEGFHVLDVGMSTGGFTDCLLQQGAADVVGVDVGHNQLSLKLKNDPRVKSLEGVNARELHLQNEVLALKPSFGFDLAVIDVSFISLTLVLPSVVKLLRSEGHCLALVKPQFEVGPEGLGKNGIVKDPSLYTSVQKKITNTAELLNANSITYFSSELEGKDGNKEFFIYFKV